MSIDKFDIISVMKTESDFGKFLKQKRESKGWSKWKLYQDSGVSYAHISLMEKGEKKPPKPVTLKKLSDSLGVPYGDMLEAAGHLNDVKYIEEAVRIKFGPLFNDETAIRLLCNKDVIKCLNCLSRLSDENIETIADAVEAISKGMK